MRVKIRTIFLRILSIAIITIAIGLYAYCWPTKDISPAPFKYFSTNKNREKLTGNDKPKPKLLFKSGFEGTTSITRSSDQIDGIKGSDNESEGLDDWSNDLKKAFGGFGFTYEGGDTTMRYARIVKDPENPNNHVLKFWLAGPNAYQGKKARVQASASRGVGLKNIYQSVRFRLSNDFQAIKNWDQEVKWLTLFEFWNNGAALGKDDPFRISVDIVKPNASKGSPLYLRTTAQKHVREKRTFPTIWTETNENFEIPTDKWLTCEIFFQEGDNKTGRFYVSITSEERGKIVIADVQNFTHAPGAKNPDGLQEYNPFKLYTGKALIEYLSGNSKKLEVLWDDFELWTDRLP